GGLRPGPSAQPLTERMADFLRHHWVEIAERTGQPFDTAFLERGSGWVYDTEPAAVAVTQLREIDEARTLEYFTSIQHGFYAEGKDVTDYSVLADLARPFGVGDDFEERLSTEEARKAAWADFSRARNWGIAGFPTLIGELVDARLALLARGWAPAGDIRERIAALREAVG
ncbi:MAG: DsbA family protein, partial [Acidimicrobiia bacterium]